MIGYQGETLVKIKDTIFKDYKKEDWVLYFIEMYGQIDGDHHKLWVLDQIAQIIHGTKVIVKLAKWDGGHEEYRVSLSTPSKKYHQWVKEMNSDGYSYDEGIAP